MDRITVRDVESKLNEIWQKMPQKVRRGPVGKLTVPQLATLCWAKAYYRVTCWKDFFENDLIASGWQALSGWRMCSYGRFMLRIPQVVRLLKQALSVSKAPWTGVGAIDSTLISLGAEYNAFNQKAYKSTRKAGASLGHGSLGKTFGIKLTAVVNNEGGLCAWDLHAASSHDLGPVKDGILDSCVGVVLADRGYVSEAEQWRLQSQGVALWARPKKNQERQFNPVQQMVYRCREVIESVFSKLKKRFSLVPIYPPRRMKTAKVHIMGSLLAYVWSDGHPRMNYSFPRIRTAT